jgi:hypothetical protein
MGWKTGCRAGEICIEALRNRHRVHLGDRPTSALVFFPPLRPRLAVPVLRTARSRDGSRRFITAFAVYQSSWPYRTVARTANRYNRFSPSNR